jgi:uncharacterized membrane protein
MRDRTKGVVTSWAFIGGCLLVLACGSGGTTSPLNEVDAGTPDGGTGNEETSSACSVPAPTACPDPAPRYADVAPIFEQRCVICHAGNPGGPWSLADYGPVADWQDTIRTDVRDCSMPPTDAGVPITMEERVAILTWIRCGLPR